MSHLGYMEKLLDGVEVEWKELNTLTKVLRGKRLVKSQLSDNEEFPVYHGGLQPFSVLSCLCLRRRSCCRMCYLPRGIPAEGRCGAGRPQVG